MVRHRGRAARHGRARGVHVERGRRVGVRACSTPVASLGRAVVVRGPPPRVAAVRPPARPTPTGAASGTRSRRPSRPSPARRRPRRRPAGPASAIFTVDGDAAKTVADTLQARLEAAGYTTVARRRPARGRHVHPRHDRIADGLHAPDPGGTDRRGDDDHDPLRGGLPARLNRRRRCNVDRAVPQRNVEPRRLCCSRPAGVRSDQAWGRRDRADGTSEGSRGARARGGVPGGPLRAQPDAGFAGSLTDGS